MAIPYAGILFLVILYNAVLYFLWGIHRWRERVPVVPYLTVSSAILACLFILRAAWAVARNELPGSFLLVALFWLLGLTAVNTILGGLVFLAARGTSGWFDRGLPIPPESEAEAPVSTWTSGEEPPRAGETPEPSDPGGEGTAPKSPFWQ